MNFTAAGKYKKLFKKEKKKDKKNLKKFEEIINFSK